MLKGISTWLIILLFSFLAIIVFFATFYFLQSAKSGFLAPKSGNITVEGVLKFNYLLNPKRDYCTDGKYIDSLYGLPFTDNETTLLVKAAPASNFTSSDLYGGVNKVVTLTGTLYKGQNCAQKNSCDCDDYIDITSGEIDATKSAVYAANLPAYSGVVKCYFPEGTACAPVLIVNSGKKYQLIDASASFELANEGLKVTVNASFDQDPPTIAGEPIEGSLYVAKAVVNP